MYVCYPARQTPMNSPPEFDVALPPGQRRIDGFPRFGTHFNRPPPAAPADPVIEISGAVTESRAVPLAELKSLPRRELTADFHCVSGWSATGLRWEGVAFEIFYRERIEPLLRAEPPITHVVFRGLDGYQLIVLIEDARAEDVLIADRLNGEPLDSDHGAPVRLVSPSQYGYMSTKHLCRIELHTRRPRARYHPSRLMEAGLRLVEPHPRSRVWEEERHRFLPGRLVRPVYHRLIGPIKALSARGSRER